MSELFAEGDLVEAVKTEIASSTRLRGVLKSTGWENGFILQAQGFSPEINELEAKGFTLTLIEKATPPLPTEPGWYSDCRDDIWRVSPTGAWTYSDTWRSASEVAMYAPFIRLEPVAETAKKVLDRVLEEYGTLPLRFIADVLPIVAKEFGVTS
jgi:hypothetical protein